MYCVTITGAAQSTESHGPTCDGQPLHRSKVGLLGQDPLQRLDLLALQPHTTLEEDDLILEFAVLHLGGSVVLDTLAEVLVARDLGVLLRKVLTLLGQFCTLLQSGLEFRLERLLFGEKFVFERLVPIQSRERAIYIAMDIIIASGNIYDRKSRSLGKIRT